MQRKDRMDHVRECISRLEQGWNHKNSYLWASAFREPCEYIDAFGRYHPQWTHEKNARMHDHAWATVYAKSHIHFLIRSIEFLSDRLCAVILHTHLHYEHEGKELVLETYITALIEHSGVDWQIRYFQNTPVRG